MFATLIRLSLTRRGLTLLLAALLVLWGGREATRLPVDVFPDLNRPTVTVLTEAGARSPEEVELWVTTPIEQAVAGAPGVERVRSQSAAGLSVVWVELGWGEDLWRGRQQVTERLDAARRALPEGLTPTLGPVTSVMGEILLIGLTSEDGEVEGPALRTLADWTVRPRLLAVNGVSQVTAIGGGVERVEVQVAPEQLAARGVALQDVVTASGEALGSLSGGYLEGQGRERVVRLLAQGPPEDALAETVLRPGAALGEPPLTLGDVATVARSVGVMRGEAGMNGRRAVVLAVQKQPQADTIAVTRDIESALSALGPGLPQGVTLTPIFRQATFIQAAVENVEEALLDGSILVAITLALFLMNLRTTAITLTAIPLSLLSAVLALSAMGQSLNTMTLGGLAVAIGELVDDAIVDVENVFRRLRENAALPTPRPALKVIAEASGEVRNSIVSSTALVVLVFVPLFALPGVEGRLFAPLGLAYITAILASMFVSLTVTPAMCAILLPGIAAKAQARGDSALVRWLKGLHRELLVWALPRPGPVLAGVTVLALGALLTVPSLGRGFLPTFNEGSATVNLLAAPGTALAESDRLATLAENLVLEVPEVRSVGRRTGRAELDEHAEGVHYTELDVDLAEGRPRAVVLADLRERLRLLPGLSTSIGQPISHRLDHMISGVRAAIVLKLFGDDLLTLRAEAARLALHLESIPGLVDLQVERQELVPQLRVEVNREAARRVGLRPFEVLDAAEIGLAGRVVGQAREGRRALDVAVRLTPEGRDDAEAVRAVPIHLPSGAVVPLGAVAQVEEASGPSQILHEGGRRRIIVSANAADRDLGAVVDDVVQRVESLPNLAQGVYVELSGQHAAQASANRALVLLSGLSLLGMIAVLYAQLGSAGLVAQVLLNIPLALIGAVAALWWSGAELSVATVVGFITLCGVATRNTVLMITHYVHLVAEEGEVFGPEMVVRGSLERLVPVAMTALCAGMGLIPLAMAEGQPGKEILTPVAQVILGGLVSSTLLDMLVTPTAFLHYGRAGLERLVARRHAPVQELL
jgi:CzcA family heavy metal efflux pump